MNWTDEEKLMLFLTRWCMELGFDMAELEDYSMNVSDSQVFEWINSNSTFKKFLSEAHEAKEEFEFWVSDYGLDRIKNRGGSVVHFERTGLFKHKIKITIED